MLVYGLTRQRLLLVALILTCFTCQAITRPQLAASASTTVLKPFFANSSISPLTASGSCWKCGIEAPGGIRLVYWQPDSAVVGGSNVTLVQNSAQAYTQVENGFTYTSPSVYVIYSSLRGTATCSTESVLYAVGPSFSEKTIAYSSRFLAYGTLSIADAGCSEFVVVGGFHTIDFSNLYYNPITTTTTYKAGCMPYVNPRLSLPHELTNVDPRWENCEPLFYGAFDPPSVLTKASGGLAPSPVGAGQITKAAVALPMSKPAPAKPIVTPGPPLAAPTADSAPSSRVDGASRPPVDVNGTPSIQLPKQQEAPKPSDRIPADSVLSVAGNTPQAQAQVSTPPQGDPSIKSSGKLGELIYSPFVPDEKSAKPKINPGTEVEATAVPSNVNNPAVSPARVAVPVKMENGKPAYAIVAAAPAATGESPFSVFALSSPDPSSGKEPAPNDREQAGIAGAAPTPAPGDIAKVTLNDGSTAEIPTANIIQPPLPEDNLDGGEHHPSGFQNVHLSAGAFVTVPGVDASLSSVAVQGGNYLLPKPTEDKPQQTLTLLNGQLTVIPSVPLYQPFTLHGVGLTNVPIDAPTQILTLNNGKATTFSPIPNTIVTLANGEVTSIPDANAIAGFGGDSSNIPLQILTLGDGQLATVPVQIPSQTLTLQGGSLTTLPGNASPQILTLANEKITTLSPIPLTRTTLANGEVTYIPASYNSTAAPSNSFLTVPDATVSGKVYYTRLPIVKLQNASFNQSKNAAVGHNGPLTSILATSEPLNAVPTTAQALLSTPSGTFIEIKASATSRNKKSGGSRLQLSSKWEIGFLIAVMVLCIRVT